MTRVLLLDAQYPYVRIRVARAHVVTIHHRGMKTAERYDMQEIGRHETEKDRQAHGHGTPTSGMAPFGTPDAAERPRKV